MGDLYNNLRHPSLADKLAAEGLRPIGKGYGRGSVYDERERKAVFGPVDIDLAIALESVYKSMKKIRKEKIGQVNIESSPTKVARISLYDVSEEQFQILCQVRTLIEGS